MSNTLGCGVIGLGVMGQVHTRIWDELPGTRLVGVCDIDTEVLTETKEAYHCSGTDSVQGLVGDPEVDIVSVCTNDDAHVEACTSAAAAGRHVLVEKPLATSVTDAGKIIRACEEAGVKLMTGHCVRFDLRYALAQESVAEGDVGDIVQVFARRNNITEQARRIAPRTSVAFYLGIHDIDLMRWVTDSEIVSVYSEGTSKVLADVSTNDSIFTLMKFADGASGCLENCWVIPEESPNSLDARLEVVGTEGRVAVRVGGEELQIITDEGMRRPGILYGPVMYGEQRGAMRRELEHFADCVRHDREPLIAANDALAAVAVCEAIQESLQTGKRVKVLVQEDQ